MVRDWMREWPCDGLPAVILPALKQPKRDPTAHHCAEQVTAEVRRVLGRSAKAKIKRTKDSQKERDEAERTRMRHKEQESSKWKPGSRNTSHEVRRGKAKQEKERKAKQEKERKANQEKERKAKQEKAKQDEVKLEKKKAKLAVSSDEENVNTEVDQQTFSELTNLTFSPNNHPEPPYHQLEAYIDNKKVWRDQPDLTDNNAEEEEVRDVANLTESRDGEDVSSEDEQEVNSGGGQECDGGMPDLTDSSDSEKEEFAHRGCTRTKAFVKRGRRVLAAPDLTGDSDIEDSRPTIKSPVINLTRPGEAEDITKNRCEAEMDCRDDEEETGQESRSETFSELHYQQEVNFSNGLLTGSSCEEKYLASAKTEALVKRGRRMSAAPELTDDSGDKQESVSLLTFSELHNIIYLPGPELTDDSEDEEDLRRTIKEERSSGSTALRDLRGGGSSETSLSFEELYTMLDLLKLAIDRTELPLRLDYDTPADGNCFSHAVVQQGRRPSVREYLELQGKSLTTFMQLKEDVRQFVLYGKHLPSVRGLKASFEQKQGVLAREGEPTRGWSTYWEDMATNGTWADDIFVQATALYLDLPIFLIIADSATYDRPVTPIGSGEEGSAERPPLFIGYISDKHYQSLLLKEEDEPSRTNRITLQALRTALDSLQLDPLEKGSEVS